MQRLTNFLIQPEVPIDIFVIIIKVKKLIFRYSIEYKNRLIWYIAIASASKAEGGDGFDPLLYLI